MADTILQSGRVSSLAQAFNNGPNVDDQIFFIDAEISTVPNMRIFEVVFSKYAIVVW